MSDCTLCEALGLRAAHARSHPRHHASLVTLPHEACVWRCREVQLMLPEYPCMREALALRPLPGALHANRAWMLCLCCCMLYPLVHRTRKALASVAHCYFAAIVHPLRDTTKPQSKSVAPSDCRWLLQLRDDRACGGREGCTTGQLPLVDGMRKDPLPEEALRQAHEVCL